MNILDQSDPRISFSQQIYVKSDDIKKVNNTIIQ